MDDVVIPIDVLTPSPIAHAAPVEAEHADLATLLDRAVAGDAAAAAAVYDRVAVSAYRIVHLVIGDGETATEVCRLGFRHLWDVWSAAGRVDRPGSARTWVLMTMHRFATDHVRTVRGGGPRPRLLSIPG